MAVLPLWKRLTSEYRARTDAFLAAQESAWKELEATQQASAKWLEPLDACRAAGGSLESLRLLFEDAGRSFVGQVIEPLQRRQPARRALEAMQTYEADLAALSRQLPESVSLSGTEFVDGFAACLPWSARKSLTRLMGRRPRNYPLRAIVLASWALEHDRRSRLDGEWQLLLARFTLHLLFPWQLYRRRMLSGVAPLQEAGLETWRRQSRRIFDQAARLSQVSRQWAFQLERRLALALLRGWGRGAPPDPRRMEQRRRQRLDHWVRQADGVHAQLELERRLIVLAQQIVGISTCALEAVESERRQLLAELDDVLNWLAAASNQMIGPLPPAQAAVVTAQQRAAEWESQVRHLVRRQLPDALEGVQLLGPLPGGRKPWRRLQPAAAAMVHLCEAGRQRMVGVFSRTEHSHRELARQIDRAREVVSYGLEALPGGHSNGERIWAEAMANARSLLEHHRQLFLTLDDKPEAALASAVAASLLKTTLSFEGSFPSLVQLVEERGLRAGLTVARIALQRCRNALRLTLTASGRLLERGLLKIGWTTPPATVPPSVERQVRLGEIIPLVAGPRDLPFLYRHLFRLAPIEDSRFLIGREQEMQALKEAYALWKQGRPVAVAIVGARGSGKTSLLNCAAGAFSDSPLLRSRLCQRTLNGAQMEQQLRSLLHIPPSKTVADALAERRCVVILEEVERGFLAEINGFAGLRWLLDLICATAKDCLWVLALNAHGFHFLNVAVQFQHAFTHRINVADVSSQKLQEAILYRHHLSGLRLQFEPPPHAFGKWRRLRRTFGLDEDGPDAFFNALHRQSEGVFRTAFELWQDNIDLVADGVVQMKFPSDPDYRDLLAQLSLEDYFMLVAILRHGSLTAAEMARVLLSPERQTAARMERLQTLEILEPEPGFPGLRVRPQALRFVHEALHRRHLE